MGGCGGTTNVEGETAGRSIDWSAGLARRAWEIFVESLDTGRASVEVEKANTTG